MKKYIIVAVVAIAAVVGLQGLRGPAEMTPARAQELLLKNVPTPAHKAFYETLQKNFPSDYEQFLEDMVAFHRSGNPSEQAAFALGQQFTSQLRTRNAHHLGTAPIEAIKGVRAANIALLDDLNAKPALCAVYALKGGGALSLAEAQALDAALVVATADATFRAIAAGRDAPVEHVPASEADLAAVLALWKAEGAITPALERALLSGDVTDPLVCEASLSFERFMQDSADPTVQRVGVYLIQASAGL